MKELVKGTMWVYQRIYPWGNAGGKAGNVDRLIWTRRLSRRRRLPGKYTGSTPRRAPGLRTSLSKKGSREGPPRDSLAMATGSTPRAVSTTTMPSSQQQPGKCMYELGSRPREGCGWVESWRKYRRRERTGCGSTQGSTRGEATGVKEGRVVESTASYGRGVWREGVECLEVHGVYPAARTRISYAT